MPRSGVPTAPFAILPTASICPTLRLSQQLDLQVLSLSGETQGMLRNVMDLHRLKRSCYKPESIVPLPPILFYHCLTLLELTTQLK